MGLPTSTLIDPFDGPESPTRPDGQKRPKNAPASPEGIDAGKPAEDGSNGPASAGNGGNQ